MRDEAVLELSLRGYNLWASQWDRLGDLLFGMTLRFWEMPLDFEQHPMDLEARYAKVVAYHLSRWSF
jgi:hypothetical protein